MSYDGVAMNFEYSTYDCVGLLQLLLANMIGLDGAPPLLLQIVSKPLLAHHLLVVVLLLLLHRSETTVIVFNNGRDQECYHPVDSIVGGSGPLDGEVSTFRIM